LQRIVSQTLLPVQLVTLAMMFANYKMTHVYRIQYIMLTKKINYLHYVNLELIACLSSLDYSL